MGKCLFACPPIIPIQRGKTIEQFAHPTGLGWGTNPSKHISNTQASQRNVSVANSSYKCNTRKRIEVLVCQLIKYFPESPVIKGLSRAIVQGTDRHVSLMLSHFIQRRLLGKILPKYCSVIFFASSSFQCGLFLLGLDGFRYSQCASLAFFGRWNLYHLTHFTGVALIIWIRKTTYYLSLPINHQC